MFYYTLSHSRVMTFFYDLEAIFGQVGTLVREPFIRVRSPTAITSTLS